MWKIHKLKPYFIESKGLSTADGEVTRLDLLREKIAHSLEHADYPLSSCLRQTLALGQGRCLSRSIWKAFNTLGLSHLLVLSGSHFSLMALGILFLFKQPARFLFGRQANRWIAYLTLAFLSAFFIVAYSGASLWRAFVSFIMIFILVRYFPMIHRYSSLDRLGICGIILLIADPLYAFDLSYLLSFGATCTFLMAPSGRAPSSNRCLQALWMPSALLGALLALLNLKAHYLSPLINLAFIPIFGFLVVPLAFLPLGVPTMAQTAEAVLRRIFEAGIDIARDVSLTLPSINPTPGVSAGFLVLGLTLGPRLKSPWSQSLWMISLMLGHIGNQLLKVYFDN